VSLNSFYFAKIIFYFNLALLNDTVIKLIITEFKSFLLHSDTTIIFTWGYIVNSNIKSFSKYLLKLTLTISSKELPYVNQIFVNVLIINY